MMHISLEYMVMFQSASFPFFTLYLQLSHYKTDVYRSYVFVMEPNAQQKQKQETLWMVVWPISLVPDEYQTCDWYDDQFALSSQCISVLHRELFEQCIKMY